MSEKPPCRMICRKHEYNPAIKPDNQYIEHQPGFRMSNNEPTIANRLTCPFCGNDIDFFQIAEDAIITTHFTQNGDGSFTQEVSDSQVLGEVKLFCGECEEELPPEFFDRFNEMVF